MKFNPLHSWPMEQNEAIRIQNELVGRLITEGNLDGVQLIAGVDTAFNDKSEILYAVVAVFRYPDLKQVDKSGACEKTVFPYVPGLHTFREGPVILKAFERLQTTPDVVIFAGHGWAHPRYLGLASHLGLILDIPSVGCARKRLTGRYQRLGPEAGELSLLSVENKDCGFVYRSRAGVKPIFISPGHKCGLRPALDLVTSCLRGYRMPEPLRLAHILAGKMRRDADILETSIPQ